MKKFSLCLLLMLTSCGQIPMPGEKEKSKEEERVDRAEYSLYPPPGEYSYMPHVLINVLEDTHWRKRRSDYIKAPGDPDFIINPRCSRSAHHIYTPDIMREGEIDNSDFYNCALIKETGTLYYKLGHSGVIGPEKSAEYVINLESHDVALTSKDKVGGGARLIELTEVETRCDVKSNKDMKVLIKLQNDKLLGDQYAYLAVEIKNPKPDMNFEIIEDEANNIKSPYAGIVVLPKTEEFSILLPPDFKYSATAELVDGVDLSPGSCVVTTSDLELGRVSKGTISCTNLRHGLQGWAEYPVRDDEKLLGRIIDLEVNWTCDWY